MDEFGEFQEDMVVEEFHEENRDLNNFLIMRRRTIRDLADPFNVSYDTFVGSYRLSQDMVFRLVDLVHDFYAPRACDLALPLELRVLCALSFYATGSYQKPTGRAFDFAVSQPTVCLYVEELTEALNQPCVAGRLIRFPESREEVANCIERNRQMGGKLPRVLGYIGGTLVDMKKPNIANNIQAYIGRKSRACINAQIVCDRRLYIMNVLARFPGATNDSYIYQMSAVRRRLVELNATEPCCLVGDSGYPCEPWLLTPFDRADHPAPDTPEARYNKTHCYDRNCVERCIGLLKMVFRALNNQRILYYGPVKVCRLIVAIANLHNMRILARMGNDDVDVANARNEYVNMRGPELGEEDLDENNAHMLLMGRAVRQEVVAYLEEQRNRR